MAHEFHSPREAAAFLTDELGVPRTASTLAKLRVTGDGPVYQKIGRYVRYTSNGLRAYAERVTSGELQSTAEAGALRRRAPALIEPRLPHP